MKWVWILWMGVGFLHGVEFKNEIGLSSVSYDHSRHDIQCMGNSELTYTRDHMEGKVHLSYLYSREYSKQRYLYLDEFYMKKDMGDYRIEAGKRILYWGELEGYNITDIFNTKNYLKDPFDTSAKLGSWSLSLYRYIENNVIEAGIKFYEDDQNLGESQTPYYPLPLPYDSALHTQKNRYTPSFYLSYGWSSDTEIESENRIILWHGYDAKRDIVSVSPRRLSQYAYQVNKALFLSHVLYGDTILKVEGSYTDVIDYPSMSDYWQVGIGAEQGISDLRGMDLTFYAEYYTYGYGKKHRHEEVDISEIYNNDLFLACKMDLNDVGGSTLKAGMLYDLKHGEKIFKAQVHTRIMDRFILEMEVLRFLRVQGTLLGRMDDSSRISVDIHYTF